MASTKLTRTQTAGTDRKKFTLSMWVKTSVPSDMSGLWCTEGGWYDGSGMACVLRHDDGTGIMTIYNPSEGGTGGNYNSTSHKFRDCNGWYHFVWAGDTSQATQADRLKIYVNGEQISYTTNNLPAQNVFWNDLNSNNKTFTIGAGSGSGHYYFEGSMSHVHFSDGYAYDASTFGSTDATTGEWKINTAPSFTLGNNGFTILKDGNTYTDQSSNSNNFTLSGTLTKTEDCPSNVFATMNPLDNYWQGSTFSNGNNTIVTGSNSATFNTSTLLMTSGKYYAEVKPTVGSATLNIGVTGEQAVNASHTLASRGSGYAYLSSSGVFNNGSSVGGTFNSYSNGDIIGIAINLDDEQDGLNKLYFSKNGVWQNGSDPSTPSSVTGVVGITKPSNLTGGESKMGAYAFAINETWNDNTRTVQWNFGNGYFGSTQISSAGTNASGNGIFEYDVPTGYTALSTKGLNL